MTLRLGNRSVSRLPRSGRPKADSTKRVTTSMVRVRYAETDKMGVVYYANYLIWFEVGRTDWLRETGWTYRSMEEEGLQLPVIEAHCEYRQGARYDDDVEIRTRARRLSPVAITTRTPSSWSWRRASALDGLLGSEAPMSPASRPAIATNITV